MATLGPEMARPAVPVLLEIIKTEKDDDLVERAKLALLRVDPAALTGVPDERPRTAAAPSARKAGWIKVRITEKGATSPKVSVTMPFALAELVFKSLPDEALRELKSEGYDAENFWQKLREMGPTEVIDIEGDQGERIRIWTSEGGVMRTMVVRAALAAAVAAATMGTVMAVTAEDDLAVVKRAVAGQQVARQEPPATTSPDRRRAGRPARSRRAT